MAFTWLTQHSCRHGLAMDATACGKNNQQKWSRMALLIEQPIIIDGRGLSILVRLVHLAPSGYGLSILLRLVHLAAALSIWLLAGLSICGLSGCGLGCLLAASPTPANASFPFHAGPVREQPTNPPKAETAFQPPPARYSDAGLEG
ncbi:hypothetical protein PMIN06_010491 [Paraphaeosphaeria minitans]